MSDSEEILNEQLENDIVPHVPGHDEHQENEIAQIKTVMLKLPPFWSNSPLAWFNQIEAQFALGRVRSDNNKYNYVISSLSQQVAEEIFDLISSCPLINKYEYIKTSLIERYSLSLEKRIKKIISEEEFGNRKPSDFYRALMRIVTGDNHVISDDMLKQIWLSRLPPTITVVLIPIKNSDIQTLLKTADSIWEVSNSNTNISFSSSSNMLQSSSNSHNNDLLREIQKLNANFQNLVQLSKKEPVTILPVSNFGFPSENSLRNQSNPNLVNKNLSQSFKNSNNNRNQVNPTYNRVFQHRQFNSFSGNRSNNNRNILRNTPVHMTNNPSSQTSTKQNQKKICFYHEMFGNKARNCQQPCLFKELTASRTLN